MSPAFPETLLAARAGPKQASEQTDAPRSFPKSRRAHLFTHRRNSIFGPFFEKMAVLSPRPPLENSKMHLAFLGSRRSSEKHKPAARRQRESSPRPGPVDSYVLSAGPSVLAPASGSWASGHGATCGTPGRHTHGLTKPIGGLRPQGIAEPGFEGPLGYEPNTLTTAPLRC